MNITITNIGHSLNMSLLYLMVETENIPNISNITATIVFYGRVGGRWAPDPIFGCRLARRGKSGLCVFGFVCLRGC